MAGNKTLGDAKRAKQDEFYTQMPDIQAEINAYLDFDENTFRGKTVLLPCDDPEWSNFTLFFAQNFERLGLRKLISTSYAPESKTAKYGGLFEYAALRNGEAPKNERGKIFVLDHDVNKNGRIDFDDLEWDYLKGDGDFRSEEVCRLRDEADVIVTNPPFSMFREFLAHANACNADAVWTRVEALYADDFVTAKKGVFEYVLGGETDPKLLNVRVFEKTTAKKAYARQTEEAKAKGVSNCPFCAVGHSANATRLYDFKEMEADHVTAWSKGGDTSEANCQMLCKTHNAAKGNR